MKNFASHILSAGLIAGMLAACSSEKSDSASVAQTVATTLKTVIQGRREGAPQRVVLSAEEYAKINVPMLQVNPVTLGGSDFLQRAATRRDSGRGAVEIWKSSDNAQVFLRNGVVIGTRGIGRDIIAADASVTVSALKTGANRSGIRTFTISDGDVTSSKFQYRCDIRNLGAAKVTFANQSLTTDHFRETCVSDAAGGQGISNEYWVQRSTGVVRKSRQWMGPAVGYFDMVLLKY
ncbi:YjbF family lipoprotein [Sulfitobacter sp. F26169L]|uniref:YjbF family lipoprotein n=1 Tax=Sulfitobacter sp. F26169L TaxID=2996015 RepID=UPI002260C3A5|nr:YjbF family lipoprotein [Sulfitobacter sp. F26169L]MCX7566014.1 YjbF family lipoprotein [Sulfitobacter sp. F26169L]